MYDTSNCGIVTVDPGNLPLSSHVVDGQVMCDFRTLFSADQTPTSKMVAGIAYSPAGSYVPPKGHTHDQDEVYWVIKGTARIITAESSDDVLVPAGQAVFIPGNVEHAAVSANPDEELILFYVFCGADSFGEIIYKG